MAYGKAATHGESFRQEEEKVRYPEEDKMLQGKKLAQR